MATLHASFRLRGNLGNLSCYTDKNGRNIVREKGGPKRQAILTSPRFERTRESISDFSSASTAASQIRRAFMPHIKHTTDSSYFNRLVGLIKTIYRTDPENIRGTKNLNSGNVYLLEDFQFNANRHFSSALDAEYTTYIDKATGKAIVQFSSFTPLTAISAPRGATHFQLLAKSTLIDKDEISVAKATKAGPLLPINSKQTDIIDLELDLKTTEEGILVVAAGIIFYTEEMEVPLSLRDGSFAIISIERIKAQTAEPSGSAENNGGIDRATALERSARAVSQQAASLVRQSLPLISDPEQKQRLTEKLEKLRHTRWLQKLERYRKG